MKRIVAILFALVAWFAVLTQFFLLMQNRVASPGETVIRFFSFFTILTNSLVAVYFTLLSLKIKNGGTALAVKPGTLTAITVYITIVGLVYQLLLRKLWHPAGLQMIVDELLHSVIPLLVLFFWYRYENKTATRYRQIPQWLIYPLVYLVFILLRGSLSGFYPYPFVDAGKLGLHKVLLNSAGLMVLFIVLSAVFIRVGKAFPLFHAPGK